MTKKLSTSWDVHKFGGTSVGDADRYRNVAKIMSAQNGATRLAIVVSAMSKVTDALIQLVNLAKARNEDYLTQLEVLRDKHRDTFANLGSPGLAGFEARLQADIADMKDVLKGVAVARSFSEETVELISGYGEIWSAQILAARMGCAWLDARDVLVVQGKSDPIPKWDESKTFLSEWLQARQDGPIVITGFIARDENGLPTTLKRNGSDYSAAIFAKLLQSENLVIWTDVDGVMSADPRKVPEAFVVPHMSYNEAMELAYFGAKVLHPKTMSPALDEKIPIFIRNSFSPQHPGTRIDHQTGNEEGHAVKGFTTIDHVALINVEGAGMMGVPGVAEKLFAALKTHGVSVIMISQASSEHSICLAVPGHQGADSVRVLEQTFFFELQHGRIQRIELIKDCTILAAVGDRMVATPGVSAMFFSALARARINVRAIAQGSSERNISVVINSADATRALRAAHAGFYLSQNTLSVGVIGPGLIGKEFLRQVHLQLQTLRDKHNLDLRVRGLMRSEEMLVQNNAIDLQNWSETFAQKAESANIDKFCDLLLDSPIAHHVLIDCTASAEVAGLYAKWMNRGLHVITPNKKSISGAWPYYQELDSLTRKKNVRFLYETTVGAGLPVIRTLRDLRQTGDRILKIEGILSGTLSYIFNEFSADQKFSQIVARAKDLGFTEPDPRDDLSGTDFARKVVILGREMGLSISLEDLEVQNLVPPHLTAIKDVSAFMAQLPSLDQEMSTRLSEADGEGQVLRYVGVIDPTNGHRVKLSKYPKSHAFAQVQGSDNIIAFTTERYLKQPLIVRGPGAGPAVTAAGVFADLLRLASSLGANL